MLGLPERTEFNKRIPKQKFYENIDIPHTLKRVFVDQIRIIYWRNKLAATTMNIAAGEEVTEIEVFEVRVQEPQFDEAVLRQIDKEIPYHILFLLTCDRKEQAWIGYKEAAASGSNVFKVSRYYHTDWVPEGSLNFSIDGLNMDAVYATTAVPCSLRTPAIRMSNCKLTQKNWLCLSSRHCGNASARNLFM